MDISIVSLFLFHTNVAGQIKGGQHQFIKLSFYDLSISHHFTSSNIFPSPPPTRLLSVLSCCQTLKTKSNQTSIAVSLEQGYIHH